MTFGLTGRRFPFSRLNLGPKAVMSAALLIAQAQSGPVQAGRTPEQADQAREQDKSSAKDVRIGRDWKAKEDGDRARHEAWIKTIKLLVAIGEHTLTGRIVDTERRFRASY